jgi:Glycosyl transferase family 2
MRISVVVPVYNEERFIGPCLDAVLQQDEPVGGGQPPGHPHGPSLTSGR